MAILQYLNIYTDREPEFFKNPRNRKKPPETGLIHAGQEHQKWWAPTWAIQISANIWTTRARLNFELSNKIYGKNKKNILQSLCP